MSMRTLRLQRLLCWLALALWIHVPAAFAEEEAEAAKPAAEKEAKPESRRWQSRSAKKQAEEKGEEEGPKREMTPKDAKVLVKAREAYSEEKYDEAEQILGKIRLKSATPYTRALVYKMNAYIWYERENPEKALEFLQKALAEPEGMPKEDRADVLFQVAQIQGSQQKWKEMIASLNTWFETIETPNSVGYYLLAMAYYQLQDYEKALAPAQKAVEIAETPQQAWLQLLLSIHLTNKQYDQATPVLLQLITLYPNVPKSYWLQLSSLYGVQEKPDKALVVLELAHRKGLLTEDRDVRRLAQLLLFNEIPMRAAQVIEQGVNDKRLKEDAETFEMLSNSFILAREVRKAEAPLARAAELSPNGKLYVRLAQVRLLQENWNDAATALRQALAKGGLADTQGNVQLLLGITYYNKNELQEARTWFARAQQFGPTRVQAQTWLEHINREIEAKNTGG